MAEGRQRARRSRSSPKETSSSPASWHLPRHTFQFALLTCTASCVLTGNRYMPAGSHAAVRPPRKPCPPSRQPPPSKHGLRKDVQTLKKCPAEASPRSSLQKLREDTSKASSWPLSLATRYARLKLSLYLTEEPDRTRANMEKDP